jgi:hypothetical protein
VRVKENRRDIFCCARASDVKPMRRDIVRTFFNEKFVPFVFRRTTKILTISITVLLIVIGALSSIKILRGLN